MREYEFSLTHILPYKNRISPYTEENGSVKTVFSHISCSVASFTSKISSKYLPLKNDSNKLKYLNMFVPSVLRKLINSVLINLIISRKSLERLSYTHLITWMTKNLTLRSKNKSLWKHSGRFLRNFLEVYKSFSFRISGMICLSWNYQNYFCLWF